MDILLAFSNAFSLTHRGLAIHTSLNLVIIGADNGLPPIPGQAIIWTNAGILLIGQ